MRISSVDKSYKTPSFGVIKPEHLFINSKGYEKDAKWAQSGIRSIEIATNDLKRGVYFKPLLDSIAKRYQKFFVKERKPDFDYFGFRNRNEDFGAHRQSEGNHYLYLTSKNRYAPYVEKLSSFVSKNGSSKLFPNTEILSEPVFVKVFAQELNEGFFNIFRSNELCKLVLIKSKIPLRDKAEVGERVAMVYSPKPVMIKLAFENVGAIYERIQKNTAHLTPENIDKITKDVARIHWYLAQVQPFQRGTGGITDILCKSLFESKGIQVSPYKSQIAPDLEAWCHSIDDYANEYKTFFENPLVPIKK